MGQARYGVLATFSGHATVSEAKAVGCAGGFVTEYASSIDAPSAIGDANTNHFFVGAVSSMSARLSTTINGGAPYSPTPNTLGPLGNFLAQ